jgi:hypothetical protein
MSTARIPERLTLKTALLGAVAYCVTRSLFEWRRFATQNSHDRIDHFANILVSCFFFSVTFWAIQEYRRRRALRKANQSS